MISVEKCSCILFGFHENHRRYRYLTKVTYVFRLNNLFVKRDKFTIQIVDMFTRKSELLCFFSGKEEDKYRTLHA